jgi:microcompartment protein CcmK/EutM
MILGRVVGTVVTTISHESYKNRHILVIQPMGLEDSVPDDDFIALDTTHQSGIGDTVLVLREGCGARQVLENEYASVISVVMGIIDSVHLE